MNGARAEKKEKAKGKDSVHYQKTPLDS